MKGPSAPALRMLTNLMSGLPIGNHLRGQSEHGGAQATIQAMRRRGWIDRDMRLTAAGRQAYLEATGEDHE
jgi:hypothetical protein